MFVGLCSPGWLPCLGPIVGGHILCVGTIVHFAVYCLSVIFGTSTKAVVRLGE